MLLRYKCKKKNAQYCCWLDAIVTCAMPEKRKRESLLSRASAEHRMVGISFFREYREGDQPRRGADE